MDLWPVRELPDITYCALELERLTRANLRIPNAERERRLVALRHEAGLERLRSPRTVCCEGSDTLEIDLQFEDGVPVVDKPALSAGAARAAIATHGCVLVRGLIARCEAQRLLGTVDRVFDSFDAAAADRPLDGWYSPYPDHAEIIRPWLRSKGGVLAGDSPRATLELADVFVSNGIADLAAQYLGELPIVPFEKWTVRRVRAEPGIEWHQDGSFLGSGIRALNVWLALSECGVGAPGLDVVPRRFADLVATGTDGAAYEWSVGEEAAARAAGAVGWCRPRFGPGDALLFDEKLLHRTSARGPMTATRYAVETWFFAAGSAPPGIDAPFVL